ncbi:facilitated trehalose transporter Tret1-like isoform X1 [Maniola jurtina]|uniref:facilitated trehalose transporter Tret1-like isoform X1 n=1 Tax=Maniola jurtina TaxID=191418 RepID=UPI001E688347|nr:facilitated trehalose transporter Tret1-like isoform X1 [Maniola jurtina]
MINERVDTLYFYKNPFKMELSYEKYLTIGTTWTPLLRQMFVCSGVTINFFIYGLFFGAPTVFVPQIRNEANSTEFISMETASWLLSISSYGSLPWTLIFPLIAKRYGRKVPYIILWLNTLVCVLLFYVSTSVTELLISGILQGMLPAIQFTVAIMVLNEYTSPKYRGIFITFKAATFFWGVWISNAIGTFYHWKNIGILIFICCIYNMSSLFWPDSPVWLATNGRFDECAKCHRWLKGGDTDSEEELKQLIFLEKENLRRKQERSLDRQNNCCIKFFNSVTTKRFYKPLIFCLYTLCLYNFSGKLVCTGYVIDIIKTITVNESTAYEAMLVLDGVTVLGMYAGVFLNKLLKRRTLLLGSASIGVMFLFILSTYLYLVNLSVISENKYLTLFILTGFSIAISCGPMIMCTCFATEMIPIKCRSLFLAIYALLSCAMKGTVLKNFPYIFKYLDLHGVFLFYGFISSVFIYILYKVLPETKDKTILEVERYFADDNKIVKEEEELMNPEEFRKTQFS